MEVLGRYILDTLQIFFPWDDDLYTYFREHGLGSSGLGSKKLPLIYTDNCETTVGVPERKRKYVIHPRFFGLDPVALGWKPTDRETEPIIPAEKPEMEILVSPGENTITLNIVPVIGGREQYHLEYSSMSEFGRIYKNWATFYLPINSAEVLTASLRSLSDAKIETTFAEESKQAQRERFTYLTVEVERYIFSYEGFDHARRYFSMNGVQGRLPSLTYDRSDEQSRRLMEPIVKLGIIHTRNAEGFEERKPQVAIKLAQPKTTTTKRGVQGKVKGQIRDDVEPGNYIVLHAADFSTKLAKVLATWNGEVPALAAKVGSIRDVI